MAFNPSKLPKELLRSKRWGVIVERSPFSSLTLEGAALLAVTTKSEDGIFFELGPEGDGFWCALWLPQDNRLAQMRLGLREFLGPGVLGIMGADRSWTFLFRSPRPSHRPPYLLGKGEVRFTEAVMGKEVPLLSEEKISALEDLVATITS